MVKKAHSGRGGKLRQEAPKSNTTGASIVDTVTNDVTNTVKFITSTVRSTVTSVEGGHEAGAARGADGSCVTALTLFNLYQ